MFRIIYIYPFVSCCIAFCFATSLPMHECQGRRVSRGNGFQHFQGHRYLVAIFFSEKSQGRKNHAEYQQVKNPAKCQTLTQDTVDG